MNNQIDFHIDSTITNLGYIGNMCHWNFGDGTYRTGHNPVHTYLGANNWTATLTVTDTLGCSSSVSHIITVPEIPMAFYSSNSPVCLNTPMCFNDLSSVPSPPFGFISEWIWNFGDGSAQDTIHFPNNPNVCHTYTTPGIYSVTLTVTDNSGFTDSYSHDQTVLPLPIANFQFTTGCAGALVQFTDASFPNGGGNIISWRWNFGDPLSGVNDTSALQNPSHIFGVGGVTYNVRLIVENFDGCSDTIIKPVYIFPNPPVQFIHDTACVTELVHFTADTTVMHTDSIVTWSWNFGDGSGISSDPISTSHLYINPGTYIVTLAVVDHHGCINSVSHDVKVNPLPIPQFSWSTPACIGSPVSFTDQSLVPAGYTGYVAKWQWDFGDGTPPVNITLPASPDVIHTFGNISPSHLVTLTVWTSDSCSAIVTHTINSIPAPTAGFSYSVVSCMGQAVQFTDLSQTNGGGSITLWNWNFGDGTYSALPNPAHTYSAAGKYTVNLRVTNNAGNNTATKSNYITVIAPKPPVASFRSSAISGNTPLNVAFTDTSTGLPTSWYWDFGDSTNSTEQNPVHVYSKVGKYTVTLKVSNAAGSNTLKKTGSITVTAPKPPAAAFTANRITGKAQLTVTFTDTSSGTPASWNWSFGDGTQNSPTRNPVHTYSKVGKYTVSLTVTNANGSNTATKKGYISVSK